VSEINYYYYYYIIIKSRSAFCVQSYQIGYDDVWLFAAV